MDVLDQEELDYVLGREGQRGAARWLVGQEAGGRAGDRVLDGRAGVLVLREPVGRVLDDEEGDCARVLLEVLEAESGRAEVEVRAWSCGGEWHHVRGGTLTLGCARVQG